jgi:hypothetical protein
MLSAWHRQAGLEPTAPDLDAAERTRMRPDLKPWIRLGGQRRLSPLSSGFADKSDSQSPDPPTRQGFWSPEIRVASCCRPSAWRLCPLRTKASTDRSWPAWPGRACRPVPPTGPTAALGTAQHPALTEASSGAGVREGRLHPLSVAAVSTTPPPTRSSAGLGNRCGRGYRVGRGRPAGAAYRRVAQC